MQMAMKRPLVPQISVWPVPTLSESTSLERGESPADYEGGKGGPGNLVAGQSACAENDGHHYHYGCQIEHDALETNAKGHKGRTAFLRLVADVFVSAGCHWTSRDGGCSAASGKWVATHRRYGG